MTEEKYHFEKNVFSREDYNFEFSPDENIIKEILKYKKLGKVLDLGCGEGGTTLKLAELGFDVTCVDISKTVIKKLKKEAEKKMIKINSIIADLENYPIREDYDIIISTGTFHFLSEKSLRELLEDCKKKTNNKGLNIFKVLLEGDPSQEDDSEGYYFKLKELKEIYSEWNILNYEEFEEYDEDEEWNNKIGFLIAQKN
ncbi:MAG: methyltransferase domain-containing protein [archaeon]